MRSKCHAGNVKAFEIDGITFYGGGASRSGGWQAWLAGEHPDLAIGPRDQLKVRTRLPGEWACAEVLPVFIELDWPDMSIPDVPPAFWPALLEDIRAQGIRTVQAQCMGGHGRTGTALAIFLGLLNPKYESVDELVTELRRLYCEKAVETSGQFEYIAEATGLPYLGRVGPSKYGSWSGGRYGYLHQQTLFREPEYGREHEAFGAFAGDLIGVTGPGDLKILVECHASDLGCTYLEEREAGETIHTLIMDGGEIEEFETLEEVADYLQLDGIYDY